MRGSARPGLERLEGKALLSGASATASGLVDSLTAVAVRSPSGAQVVETFTETNVSNHDLTVTYGPSDDGFAVTQGGKAVWNPEGGVSPQFLVLKVLKPHQSLTIGGTWDGRADDVSPAEPWAEGPPLSGTFTVSNALDQGKATATVALPKAWTVPARATHVVPPRPAPQVHAMGAIIPSSS